MTMEALGRGEGHSLGYDRDGGCWGEARTFGAAPAQNSCHGYHLAPKCLEQAGSRTCLGERARPPLEAKGSGLLVTHRISLCHGGNYSLLSPSAPSFQHTQALPTSQQVARAQSCSLVISHLHLSSPQAVRAILIKHKPDQVPPLLPTTLRRCCPCNALHSLTSQLHASGLLSPWLILSQPYWLPSSLLKGVRHTPASGHLHWLFPLPGPLHPRSPHRPHSHLLQVLTQCRLSIASSLTHLT